MRILQNQIQNIIPKHQQMIFCTCAETNQKFYLERIQYWIKHLQNLNIFETSDVYIFNDGKIIQDINKDIFKQITFVYFNSALGRINVSKFPGFKRSFYKAMELSLKYKYCLHIESDCLIQNKQCLLQNYQKENITAFCQNQNHHYLESIFMILNNKNIRQKLADKYSIKSSQEESTCFELSISNILSDHIDLGKSFRMQRQNKDLSKYICLGQCSNQYLKEHI